MGVMSKPKPARCRTTNWSDDNAALRARGSLLIWLDKEMGKRNVVTLMTSEAVFSARPTARLSPLISGSSRSA